MALRDLVSRTGLRSLLVMGSFVVTFRWCVASPYEVPTPSMEPTIKVGDRVLGNHLAYGLRLPLVDRQILTWGSPQRGDIVLFKSQTEPGVTLVKRVVAVAGDRVAYRHGQLFVNGEPQALVPDEGAAQVMADATDHPDRKVLYDETLAGRPHYVELDPVLEQRGAPTDWPTLGTEYTVPEGDIFASGDNRDNSSDSRYWGPVPIKDINGRASRILWSAYWDRGQALPTVRIARFGAALN